LRGLWWKRAIIVLFVTLGACCLAFYLTVASYPSTRALARNYLDAVIDEDLERAMRWTSVDCQGEARARALEDIARYGGVEIRNLVIETRPNSGSDEGIEIADVRFEHRRRGTSIWRVGRMWIVTDHDFPGWRSHCGNSSRAALSGSRG
jgi:hypothetical protein